MRRVRRTVLSACVTLAALAGAARPAAQPGTAGLVLLSVELPDDPAAGARLFAKKRCSLCHALGDQEPRVGPSLGRTRDPGSILDLAGAFWNHAPVMRAKMVELGIPAPTLTAAEMANLAAFLTAYRYYQTAFGEPGDPEGGRRVFVAKGCAGCHDDDAVHGRRGPNLQRYRGRFSGLYLAQAMWNHGPEMAQAMKARGVPWPTFSGREMADLVAYLQRGHTGPPASDLAFQPGNPRRGREVFTAKQCDRCHGIGEARGGAPDLSTRGLLASAPAIAGIMWNHSQAMAAEFARRGVPRIQFTGNEMADLVTYLYFVNYANVRGSPARGARQFAEKCAACHGSAAGGLAPDLLVVVPQLGGPIAVVAAMWNHAPTMAQELEKRGLAWPRFAPGEAADLAAFLLGPRPDTPGVRAFD
jgi:cytochrome c2